MNSLPISWLVEQHVPLIFFIIALLTEPSSWAKKVTSLLNEYRSKSD